MKKVLVILFLGFFSCKNSTYSPIKKCFNKEELQVINKGVIFFEEKLKEKYPQLTKEASYFEFISDLSHKSLDPSFFYDKNSDSIFSQIRNLKIWNVLSRSNENMVRESKIYNVEIMNPKWTRLDNDISYCLASLTKINSLKSFLISNSKNRLSPKLAKDMLFKTNEYDLKNYQNRIIIALGLFYQTSLNIN